VSKDQPNALLGYRKSMKETLLCLAEKVQLITIMIFPEDGKARHELDIDTQC
jgi:hypothetical protein